MIFHIKLLSPTLSKSYKSEILANPTLINNTLTQKEKFEMYPKIGRGGANLENNQKIVKKSIFLCF